MANAMVCALLVLLLGMSGVDAQRPALNEILDRETAYCRRLELAALDFVCLEDVTEKIDQSKDILWLRWKSARERPPTSIKRTFLYDFQFVRKAGEVRETRTLLKKNGQATIVKGAELETRNFVYKNAVLAPIGIFGAQWRDAFDYGLAGRGSVGGRPCLIIEAVPKEARSDIGFLSGRAFLDGDTLEILKVEWSERNIGNTEMFEERARRYRMKLKITVTSEFEVEKNGIRFPTRHMIEEAYIGGGGKFVRSRTTVSYRDFRFFTVSVE